MNKKFTPIVLQVVVLIILGLTGFVPQRAFAQAISSQETGVVVVGERIVLILRANVGSITPPERAAIVNQRLEHILSDPKLSPEQLKIILPSEMEGTPLISLGSLILIGVTPADAREESVTQQELAQQWERSLREALIDVKPLYRKHNGDDKPAISFFAASAGRIPCFLNSLGRRAVSPSAYPDCGG